MNTRRGRSRPARLGVGVTSLVLAASACAGGPGTTAAPAAPTSTTTTGNPSPAGATPTVLLQRGTPDGTVLVDRAGAWLYVNRADTAGGVGDFTCTGGCLRSWHPFLLTPSDLAPVAPRGVAASLAVVQRPGGGQQVTYAGAPLYLWAGGGRAPAGGGWTPVVVHAGQRSGRRGPS